MTNEDHQEAYRRTLEDLITSTGVTFEEGERIMQSILESYGDSDPAEEEL